MLFSEEFELSESKRTLKKELFDSGEMQEMGCLAEKNTIAFIGEILLLNYLTEGKVNDAFSNCSGLQ